MNKLKQVSFLYKANRDNGLSVSLEDDFAEETVELFEGNYVEFLETLTTGTTIKWYIKQLKQAILNVNIIYSPSDEDYVKSMAVALSNIYHLTKYGAIKNDNNNGVMFISVVQNKAIIHEL